MLNELVITAISFGFMGYLVGSTLTLPGEVLAHLPRIVQWVNRSRGVSPFDWNPLQHWSNKITWNCGKCIAGFWSLISSLLLYQHTLGQGFIFITLAIFTAHATEKWLN